MTSKISVIVPVYKTEKYLEECVNSIINQTYQNLEVILVDDGSPDNCPTICEWYAAQDSRIKVIHKENGGLSSARNAGLAMASGDWIAFVDSDDFCDPNMYRHMLEVGEKENVPLVISTGWYHSEIATKRMSAEKGTRVTKLSSTQMITEWLWTTDENTVLFTIAWNKLYRRHFFRDILAFQEGIIHEDEEFSTRLYLEPYDIIFLDEPLYYYRANPNSITYKPFSPSNCVILDILYDRCRKYAEKGWSRLAQRAAKNFCEIYIEYGLKAYSSGHFEWVSQYRRRYIEMRRFLGIQGAVKDHVRYLIFDISPKWYRKSVLKSSI